MIFYKFLRENFFKIYWHTEIEQLKFHILQYFKINFITFLIKKNQIIIWILSFEN